MTPGPLTAGFDTASPIRALLKRPQGKSEPLGPRVVGQKQIGDQSRRRMARTRTQLQNVGENSSQDSQTNRLPQRGLRQRGLRSTSQMQPLPAECACGVPKYNQGLRP